MFKMTRHLERRHEEESQVSSAIAKNTLEKQTSLSKHVNSGIFNHNRTILQTRSGELIVGRVATKRHVVED